MDLLNHILCSSSWLCFPDLSSSKLLRALLPVFFSRLSPTNLGTLSLIKSPLVFNNDGLNLQRSFFHPKSQKITSSAPCGHRMRRSIGFLHKNDSLEVCIFFNSFRISNVVDQVRTRTHYKPCMVSDDN
ncbi:hypothetical protein ES332_D11G250200v1 [Gossypium tomentosum]|uniref:Uncharacterized protein n=1 Tax=Gossypium tomentosum TaxID=34277 RepID=A0A5D2IRX6_GOSTO|nr:hypothetical protein ES332_D11G250200v1 [Gossypium tomentosum]